MATSKPAVDGPTANVFCRDTCRQNTLAGPVANRVISIGEYYESENLHTLRIKGKSESCSDVTKTNGVHPIDF
jgi:hypothetical protein